MDIVGTLKSKWWVFALVFIFLFCYYIRAQNIVPDRLLSFDPIFQYRYTKYLVDWGHLPVWDELTYYVGRKVDFTLTQPLMYYITALVYWFFSQLMSLLTVASYMSAIYGALIVIAAFLLGKELSNNYGGLLTSVLAGTAPQILVRTFGSSYDTDQIVLLFLTLTLYLGLRALKKRTVYNFSLALAGFSAFMLAWGDFLYTLIILAVFVVFYFAINALSRLKSAGGIAAGIKDSFGKTKAQALIIVLLFVGVGIVGYFNDINILMSLSTLVGFAQNAEQWIVNVSIAELQPFNIFSNIFVEIAFFISFLALLIAGIFEATKREYLMIAFIAMMLAISLYSGTGNWITLLGNFATSDTVITAIIFLFFITMISVGIFESIHKKSFLTSAFLVTLLLIAIYSSLKGIRFTEFTSIFFIALVGSGFGILVDHIGNDTMKKTIVVGSAIFVALIAMGIGSDTGKQVGPDINANWDNAWMFLRTQTPELSLVGTWWDPGHMITGLADRRVIADGAHCELGADGQPACLYTINDRIADLGKIMVTSDENVSLSLIRKYQGDSPDVYWIASDDLIGKFQWLQYFGIGCDARVDQSCPLYIQIPQQSQSTDQNGNVVLLNYGSISVYLGLGAPVPIYTQGVNGAIFDETIYYSNGNVTSYKLNDTQKQSLIQSLKPLETQLNFRFSNQSIPMSVWMPADYSYIVIIPQNLRNSVFTKMFMLEGAGLEHFKEVFSNSQVKIFKVV